MFLAKVKNSLVHLPTIFEIKQKYLKYFVLKNKKPFIDSSVQQKIMKRGMRNQRCNAKIDLQVHYTFYNINL